MEKLSNIETLLPLINNGHLQRYKDNNAQKTNIKKKLINRWHNLKFLLTQLFSISKKPSSKNWLIYETSNNYQALLFLSNDKNIFVKPYKDIRFNYLIFYKLLMSIPLLFYLSKKHKKKWFFAYFDALGLLEESERILKKYKPEKLIFSNDHNPIQVALRIKAQKLGIPTYYFQHACVGLNMPPLNFDYAFLDGQDAYDKYKQIGKVKSKIELIGVIRAHSKNLVLNQNNKVKNIGLALNLYDKIEDVEYLTTNLLKVYPNLNFVIRLHPADKRNFNKTSEQITLSNARQENVFNFLKNIDLLIAGDSAIHLDATLVNVVSIYYKFSKHKVYDIYQFIQNGLVDEVKDKEKLIEFIGNQIIQKSNVLHRAAYYDEYIRSGVDYNNILKKYNLL